MAFFVQYQPANQDPQLEDFDTEPQAEARAHELVYGRRIERVVVFEADIADEEPAA